MNSPRKVFTDVQKALLKKNGWTIETPYLAAKDWYEIEATESGDYIGRCWMLGYWDTDTYDSFIDALKSCNRGPIKL